MPPSPDESLISSRALLARLRFLLVLFFVVGVMRTCGDFAQDKKPEHALKLFIRFALAKGAVTLRLRVDDGSVPDSAGRDFNDYESRRLWHGTKDGTPAGDCDSRGGLRLFCFIGNCSVWLKQIYYKNSLVEYN